MRMVFDRSFWRRGVVGGEVRYTPFLDAPSLSDTPEILWDAGPGYVIYADSWIASEKTIHRIGGCRLGWKWDR